MGALWSWLQLGKSYAPLFVEIWSFTESLQLDYLNLRVVFIICSKYDFKKEKTLKKLDDVRGTGSNYTPRSQLFSEQSKLSIKVMARLRIELRTVCDS